MDLPSLTLRPGREKSVLHRHPWIFSGAVASLVGSAEAGDTVMVKSANGNLLGRAAFNPSSQIRARMWSWDPDQPVDADFFRQKLEQSITLRKSVIPAEETNAMRLVFAESDELPGLVVDRYADILVMQCLTSGAERWRSVIVDLLVELTGVHKIYERSDVDVRKLEGMAERTGPILGDAPEQRVQIQENGLKFWVDISTGHKTGFYLDQRRNRARLRWFSGGKDVLNCFSYSGAFSVYALAGGAKSVLSVDSSADALKMGMENVALNDFNPDRASWLEGDVFHVLRTFRDRGSTFDLIVLDPPKFAQTAAQAERAARGYKDINLLAFKLLRPGGILFTFSCSGGVSADLFQKIVAGAALDAGEYCEIVGHMAQGADHPVALNFPEAAYLKGLICYKK